MLDTLGAQYLFRKDAKMAPVLFNERRNYENLLKFITENSTLNLKSKNRKVRTLFSFLETASLHT